jgi:hypothetical protein
MTLVKKYDKPNNPSDSVYLFEMKAAKPTK